MEITVMGYIGTIIRIQKRPETWNPDVAAYLYPAELKLRIQDGWQCLGVGEVTDGSLPRGQVQMWEGFFWGEVWGLGVQDSCFLAKGHEN